MRCCCAARRRGRRALPWLLAAATLAGGCGRLPDEAWLRVVGVRQGDASVSTVTSVVETITVTPATATTEETTTRALGATDFVTLVLQNQSTIVGTDAAGDGITVTEVRISYRLPGREMPGATIPVTRYVPASGTSTSSSAVAASSAGQAELEIPLVGTVQKSWLAANVPAAERRKGVAASARIALSAVSDGGARLETEAAVGIEFIDQVPNPTAAAQAAGR